MIVNIAQASSAVPWNANGVNGEPGRHRSGPPRTRPGGRPRLSPGHIPTGPVHDPRTASRFTIRTFLNLHGRTPAGRRRIRRPCPGRAVPRPARRRRPGLHPAGHHRWDDPTRPGGQIRRRPRTSEIRFAAISEGHWGEPRRGRRPRRARPVTDPAPVAAEKCEYPVRAEAAWDLIGAQGEAT